MVKHLVGDRTNFEGRRRKGAKDLVNSMLNYGYGILYSRIETCLEVNGLNVQISFQHSPQYGEPTLVYDFIEMFRAPVVDRTVISLITKGHNLKLNNKGWLTDRSRKKMATAVLDRLHTYVRFRSQKSRTLAEIIDYTAKEMGKYLKGEAKKFYPFISKW